MIKACVHCGLDTKNIADDFCCLGCSSAYKVINGFGLKSYYELRAIDPKERSIKPEIAEKIDISEFVREENGVCAISLMVQGIHCAACVWLIESILKKQQNVVEARINLSRKSLFLKWQGDKNLGNELIFLIEKIGYKLLPFDEEIIKAEEKKYDNTILKAMAVAGFGVGNVMLFSIVLWFSDANSLGQNTRNLMHFFSALIALPVIIYSARPFFLSALSSIKSGYPNMDLAISIAILLASVVSLLETFRGATHVYFDSALMLVFFLLIGRYLDLKARKKAFAIASEFSMLAASFGRVELADGKTKILPIKDLKKDMILLVAAGEKIAADGVIIDGEGEVDTSLIDGESLPKIFKIGSNVYSGMINLTAPLKIKVLQAASESLLAKIIALTEAAESKKNHYIRIADRLSKFYTPAVHLLALAAFILWCFYFKSGWEIALMNATAVLIITCPCALALAVPIVQTIAISDFIKKGILVKSGEALEKLREINVVVFDKTGSITFGRPSLRDMFLIKNQQKILPTLEQKNKYLALAASLAVKSKHPIAQALLQNFLGNLHELKVEEAQGFGLSATFENKILKLGRKSFCEIKSEIILDENLVFCFMKFGEEEIIFTFSDEIKEDAKIAIESLKGLDKKIILLSGDHEKIVQKMAQELSIAEFYFEKTPLEKAKILQKLKAQKQKILMIGDGLNDAPSLALADVSISFAEGVHIAQNIADIVIQGRKLMPIIELINCANKAILLMRENLIIALIYNLIAVPFAILGYVVPLIAAIAMSSSSILVLLNSLRMSKIK